MSKPAPKQNFLQTFLLFTAIYFGLVMMCNKPGANHGTAPKTPDQAFEQLRKDNAEVKDTSIVATNSLYQGLIDEAVKAKKMTPEDAEAKRIEAAVIVADTQYKAGEMRNDTQRMRNGYNTLVKLNNALRDTPLWTKTYKVAGETAVLKQKFPDTWSGQTLYDHLVTEISKRNRTDLIWGFIPGGFAFIDFLVHLTGATSSFSYAFAAFLLALLVRGIVYPLTQKQLMFSRQMSQLSPLIKEIKDKYADDPQKQQVKTMELYKEYGINPFAGCWPAFIQLPLFLGVYQAMLHYQFEFHKGTFLWINESTAKSVKWIAPNLGQLDYILIVIYGVSMIITTLLQPVNDPTQAKQQKTIGLVFAVFVPVSLLFGLFPVAGAFVLYWTFTNILATAQSLRAYRLPLPPLVKVNAAGGGVYPKAPQGKWAQIMDQMQKAAEEQQRKQGLKPDDTKKDSKDDEDGGTGRPVTHKPKKRK
jgi:YidC/Oxa1 family membrane protein insertase